MSGGGPSWTRSLVGFAAAVLLAGWAINAAAQLVLEVWPLVVVTILLIALSLVAFNILHGRDRW